MLLLVVSSIEIRWSYCRSAAASARFTYSTYPGGLLGGVGEGAKTLVLIIKRCTF